MSGMFLIPLNAENRAASRVGAGDMVDVTIEQDDEPRDVEVADDLRTAIAREPAAEAWFNQLSYTHRNGCDGSRRRSARKRAGAGSRRRSPRSLSVSALTR
jgi:hypothetical protein